MELLGGGWGVFLGDAIVGGVGDFFVCVWEQKKKSIKKAPTCGAFEC